MEPDRPSALELEEIAAQAPPPGPSLPAPASEAEAMLRRRGFFTTPGKMRLPFPADLEEARAAELAERLSHYAFRLFLRGALQAGPAFDAEEATRYLAGAQAHAMAQALVDLELAVPAGGTRYRLLHPVHSFGGTLEWYVARELHGRLGFDVAVNRKFHAPGVGGDLDVVAAAEGRLVHLELKSSPPKHLTIEEVSAFFDRVHALRPDLALFVVDTALRLGDRVVPMLEAVHRQRRRDALPGRRVDRGIWALGPHLYAVNAKADLMANVGRAIAEGLRSLAPTIV